MTDLKGLTEEEARAVHSGIAALTALINGAKETQVDGLHRFAGVIKAWEKDQKILGKMMGWKDPMTEHGLDIRMRKSVFTIKRIDTFTWEATVVSPGIKNVIEQGRTPWNAAATAEREVCRRYKKDREANSD